MTKSTEVYKVPNEVLGHGVRLWALCGIFHMYDVATMCVFMLRDPVATTSTLTLGLDEQYGYAIEMRCDTMRLASHLAPPIHIT